jgi:HKD family nuclease
MSRDKGELRMAQEIALSGVGSKQHGEALRRSLIREHPRVVGIAAAFVSVEGVQEILGILRQCGQPRCRLVAGTDNAITHPQALYVAREEGWRVRLGRPQKAQGIFHPKMIVAGERFSREGVIDRLCYVYVGSSNLTAGGLKTNVECGFMADADGCIPSASDVFADLWSMATPATNAELRHYAARFAERARRRPVSELNDLGVNDARRIPSKSADLRVETPPRGPAIGTAFAVAAWTGLQSFTGEYRFLVEFPRYAGEVVGRLIRGYAQVGGRLEVYCPADETTRPMQYRFYADNSMFRLNVPNDVPGVGWARTHHDGLAIVEQGPPGGARLRLRILRPGADASEIVGRSAALGTWGRTTTRAYGWY